jgi:ribosomal protein S12 methylthiotransferase accessory factor
MRRELQAKTARMPRRPEDVHSLHDHAFYYAPRSRLKHADFLRRHSPEVALGDLPHGGGFDLRAWARARADEGVRIAIVDVTSPDVLESPFRVVRALGTNIQPIVFGHALQPLDNPRLHTLLGGREVNPYPHPLA